VHELEELFLRYEGQIYAFVLRMVGSRDVAEEIAQETFVRACAAALRFDGLSSVKTWLFGIARNVVREHRRSRREEPGAVPERVAHQPDIATTLHLREALAKLGEDDRELVLLVDAIGFSPREMASSLGITDEAVRVRLHRARRRLRQILEGGE
jgi:RNA polymerase sigma-70 factor, ECF subfamily